MRTASHLLLTRRRGYDRSMLYTLLVIIVAIVLAVIVLNVIRTRGRSI